MASALPSLASTKEKTNYALLCRLLVSVGSQALKDSFDQIHPPADLPGNLARPPAHPILQFLRKKRILNPTQWGKLYPIISSSVSSTSFDITLLITLLRNICNLRPPPTGWDNLPSPDDTTLEANIARLRFYRNKVYSHASQASVDDKTFERYWKDIRNVLVGLGAGASYLNAINRLKTERMDSDIEEHFQELLKMWKKDDDDIGDRLDELEGVEAEGEKKRLPQTDDSPPRLSIELPKACDLPKTRKKWSDVELPIDFLLLTVEDCEFLSCFAYLDKPFKSYDKDLGFVWFGSMDKGVRGKLKIAIICCNLPSISSRSVLLVNAVRILQPKAAFSVGVCKGLTPEKAKLGDVIVPFKLTTPSLRAPIKQKIINFIRHAAHGWIPPLERLDKREVKVHSEGDFLSNPDIIQKYPEALAVDTNGVDFYVAGYEIEVEWVIVKGIAGYGDLRDDWTSFASTMAASFVPHILCFRDWLLFNTDLIPAYVRAGGEKALAAYNRALETGWTYDKRVKVLLVGQDRVGKTSLSKNLRGEPFRESEPSTEGVTMIPPVMNAGTGAWTNPAHLKGTNIFDHKMATKITDLLSSKLSELSVESPMGTVEAEDLDPMSEEVVREDAGEGNPPVSRHAQHQNIQQENVEENPGEGNPPASRHAQHQNIQQENVEGNLKQREPFRAAQKKELVVPEGVTSLLKKVENSEFEVDQGDKIWTVIWDFAGQDLFRAIHPIFMSPEDIYLLVFNLRKRLTKRAKCRVNVNGKEHTVRARDCEDTNLDHLLRWMDLIHSLEKSYQNEKSTSQSPRAHPPVILVGTHADCVSDPSKEMQCVARKCSRVLAVFADHIVKHLPVDNTKAGESADKPHQADIKMLRKEILDTIETMPHTKKVIPLQWHRVEKEISKKIWQDKKFLQEKTFEKDIVSLYCTFDHKGDFCELLHFLHSRGTIIYHKHADDYDGLVVLDPQWLINVIGEIIKVTPNEDDEIWLIQDREVLGDEGILSRRLLDHACQRQNLDPIQDSLVSLMEKFNLILKWPSTESEDSPILVPCMLTTNAQEENTVDEMTGNCTAPVYVTFVKTNYVPSGLFCRLVVLIGKWLSPKHRNEYSLYANAAKFALGKDGHFLCLVCYKTVIKIYIKDPPNKGPAEPLPSSEHCKNVLCHLMEFFEELKKECHWLSSMSTQMCVRCTICLEEHGDDTKRCMRHNKTACLHHDCAHYIPLESKVLCCEPERPLQLDKLQAWIEAFNKCKETGKHGTSSENQSSPTKRKFSGGTCCTITPAKQRKLACAVKEGCPSDRELHCLAGMIAEKWRPVGREFGFEEWELTLFHKDNEEYREKAYAMLLAWKHKKGWGATYQVLKKALCDVGRTDLAKKFCYQSLLHTLT